MSRGSISHNYDYIPACSLYPNYQGHQLVLTMRQQPMQARVSTNNERDRKPIEPPPIIQIQLNHAASSQETQDFLQNPYFFMHVNLVNPISKEHVSQIDHQTLSGQTVSSMYKLKDITDQDGGFFCFGDLSSRIQGEYQLKFSLFEIVTDGIINIKHTFSNVFKVYNSKTMPGLIDATFLSRSFSDQGVRIRIRKEHRVQVANSKRRKLSAEDQDDQVAQSPPPYQRDSRHSSLTSHHLTSTAPTPLMSTSSSNSYYNTATAHTRNQQDERMQSSEAHYHHHPPTLIYPTQPYNNDPIHSHSFSPAPHPYDLRSRQNSLVQQQQQQQPLPPLHVQEHHSQDLRHHYHRYSGPTSNTLSPPSMKMEPQQQCRRQSADDKIMFPLSPRPSISSTETAAEPPPPPSPFPMTTTNTTTADFERRRSTTSSLSTTESINKKGWAYHRYPTSIAPGGQQQQQHAPFRSSSIKPPPSPTNSHIRLPPLHTMIPHTDDTNDDDHSHHRDEKDSGDDGKGDVGHVNAAVAMMQLSQHRHMDTTKEQGQHETHPHHHHHHHSQHYDSSLLDSSRRLSTDSLNRDPC